MSQFPTGHQTAARFTAVTGPYELAPGPHLFTDWRFIDAGKPSYVDEAGMTLPVKGEGSLRPVWHRGVNVPHGVRIVSEQPVKSDAVVGPIGPSVIYDGGQYRSWEGANHSESTDGFNWKSDAENHDRNTLFFDRTGIHGPGVFIDDSAPPKERYKMVFMSALGPEREALRTQIFEKYKKERPHDIDPQFDVRGRIDGIFGAVSADGFDWQPIDGPFLLHMADNPNICCYDVRLQKYVLYTRATWMYGRRGIGRSESDTFGPFPQPEMLVWSDLSHLPSDDVYTNAKCVYPGTLDYHFLFPAIYHRADDNCSIEMMSSPDGIHWSTIPGEPVVTGNPETFDDGCMFTSCGLVPLDDGKVGLPYKGSTFPHKYPRWKDRNDRGQTRYAIWEKERLAAVEATSEGFFATPVLQVSGRQLRLNCKTPMTGEIRVEAVAITSWVHKKKTEEVIAGHSFENCDPISGDHLSHPVTWNGRADVGYAENQSVYFRFKMRAAKIFAFEC